MKIIMALLLSVMLVVQSIGSASAALLPANGEALLANSTGGAELLYIRQVGEVKSGEIEDPNDRPWVNKEEGGQPPVEGRIENVPHQELLLNLGGDRYLHAGNSAVKYQYPAEPMQE